MRLTRLRLRLFRRDEFHESLNSYSQGLAELGPPIDKMASNLILQVKTVSD
jgi:hypothetical protein